VCVFDLLSLILLLKTSGIFELRIVFEDRVVFLVGWLLGLALYVVS